MADSSFEPAEPLTTWLSVPQNNDRDMKLEVDFVYTDPDRVKWLAPKGSIINGASIPSSLWSTVGSPYTGGYRRASIVHDVACDNARNNNDRAKADKMFFHACIDGGCSRAQANLLYTGVRIGAFVSPPSPVVPAGVSVRAAAAAKGPVSDDTVRVFEAVQKKLSQRSAEISLAEIDQLVIAELKKPQQGGARAKKKAIEKKGDKKKSAASKAPTRKTSKTATKKAARKKTRLPQ